MNYRECAVMTLNHQEPDKDPIDLASILVTTIVADAYHNLRDYLGLPPDNYTPGQQNIKVKEVAKQP